MKKLILLTVCALLALVGCKEKKSLPFDPYTQITLNATVPMGKVTPSVAPYSIDTILRYAMIWSCKSKDAPGLNERGLAKEHRDFIAKRLFIGGNSEVVKVDRDGNPQLGWIIAEEIYDVVLGVKHLQSKPGHWVDIMNPSSDYSQEKDTLGYIPNRVIRDAERKIKAAFEAGSYDECLRLFHEAYVFQPITGAQWRALKAKGEN
ncbi:MAG: hypothetical protein RSB32_07550 [Mucinivorans sp.]